MNAKSFMPCIYLYQKRAVLGIENYKEVSFNPVELAKSYSENLCDRIYIHDLSGNDQEHDQALDIIKEICANVAVPVTGTGNIHRMEDVKKLLYAGCKQVTLDLSNEQHAAILEEVSLKFGKDKIAVGVNSPAQITENHAAIESYASEVMLFNGAGIREAALVSKVPVMGFLPEVSLDKIIEVLSFANISGISGTVVNENVKNISDLKKLCSENHIDVSVYHANYSWSDLKKGSDGLVPVVVQDAKTDAVLMVAYMNEEAYNKTLETGRMTYYSRSRDELWIKGETSGHYQYVHTLTTDCDLDTILAKVTQVGAACHTGSYSCFFNEIQNRSDKEENHNPLRVFEEVFSVIEDRKLHPKEGSYTNYLFDKGIDKILKKLGEEATEIVIAAKNPNPNEIKYEISDFLYHMMVLMVEKGVTWEEITTELANR
ncbi:MAG: bifunctional phosphoribosyl-AMP cyclohydrolase/phosphoribosyl-ATP diphosphatase HisIE [Lachnospiraceae bacterium]|nr:bifunctional phosphoribosyl-AMP cyclohydrolase/phosphoribosyl-ATP diphosphatase HisIE [Lachnospiraceae bacterium]